MAKAEKIVVELSARDRELIQKLIDAVGIKAEDAPAAEQTIKRLTEPVTEDLASTLSLQSIEAAHGQIRNGEYIPEGEGDWVLNNEEKVGNDD